MFISLRSTAIANKILDDVLDIDGQVDPSNSFPTMGTAGRPIPPISGSNQPILSSSLLNTMDSSDHMTRVVILKLNTNQSRAKLAEIVQGNPTAPLVSANVTNVVVPAHIQSSSGGRKCLFVRRIMILANTELVDEAASSQLDSNAAPARMDQSAQHSPSHLGGGRSILSSSTSRTMHCSTMASISKAVNTKGAEAQCNQGENELPKTTPRKAISHDITNAAHTSHLLISSDGSEY